MDELNELLDQLAELNVEADQFADALKAKRGTLYQAIFNRGHSTATREGKSQVEQMEEQLEQERQRAAKAEAKAAKLEEEQPDVAKIKKEYEDEMEQLRAELEEARTTGTSRVQSVLDSRARSDLKAKLISEYGFDKDYAEVMADRHASRIRHTPVEGEDGEFSLEVTVAGKQIPMQAEDPLGALAQEIDGGTDAKWKSGTVDEGGRIGNRGGGGGGGDMFDRIRKDVEEKREGKPRETAAERMGLASANKD